MNRRSPVSPRAAVLLSTALLCHAASAGESDMPIEVGSILGFEMGSSRLQQLIEEKSEEAARTGEWRKGMDALAAIARGAKAGGDRTAWIDAELAWVRLAAKEGGDNDLDDALDELVSRARDWGLARQEAEIYRFWAGHLEQEDQWLMAVRALESATQAALGDGLINLALTSMIDISRLCRENNHPWRLQQIWIRIGQVEQEFAAAIDRPVKEKLDTERTASQPLVDELVPLTPAKPTVDLQPSKAAVRVSAPHGEVGRARFLLTNETVHTVRGRLTVAAREGTVKKWDSGYSGQWLTLGSPAPVASPAEPKSVRPSPSSRDLSLRPGERISVYVEREMPAVKDTVNLSWTGPTGDAMASGEFSFAAREPESTVTIAGSFTARAGWNQPFYHEFNYRGRSVKIEDFQFLASVPCRLEIFDVDGGRFPSVDAGKLLAVDAEGDGCYDASGDEVPGDLNADGTPDLMIGDRSRSIEVYAWPLVPLPPGEEITVSASLRQPSEPGTWRKAAENFLSPAASDAAPENP